MTFMQSSQIKAEFTHNIEIKTLKDIAMKR